MCLVDVYGKNSVPDCEERLKFPVLLKGALVGNKSEEPILYIKRTMREKGLIFYLHVYSTLNCWK